MSEASRPILAEVALFGRTLRNRLTVAPTWGMEISYEVQSVVGKPIRGRIHNTIHKLNR